MFSMMINLQGIFVVFVGDRCTDDTGCFAADLAIYTITANFALSQKSTQSTNNRFAAL